MLPVDVFERRDLGAVEWAATSNPSGVGDTESPWLIQTDWSIGSPRNNAERGGDR